MLALSLVIESDDVYLHQLLFVADEAAAFTAIRDQFATVKSTMFDEDEWAEIVEEYPTDKELVEFLAQSLDGDLMLDYKIEEMK